MHLRSLVLWSLNQGTKPLVSWGRIPRPADAFDAVHHSAQAEVRVFKQRALVDLGVAWMEQDRNFAR